MRLVFTFLLVVAFSGILSAAGPDPRLDEAAKAYHEGDYQKAVELYQSVLEEGAFSAELYYNLGYACFKAGKLACARLNYERALIVDPGDETTMKNLEALKKTLPDQFAEVAPFAPVTWWRSCAALLSVDGWSVMWVLWVWVLCGLLWLRWKGGWKWSAKAWWQAAVLSGLLLLLTGALLLTRLKMLRDYSVAVVIQNEVLLKSAPDEFGTELLALHAGTKVVVLDQLGEQLKVELPNGDTGWLPEDALERVVPIP